MAFGLELPLLEAEVTRIQLLENKELRIGDLFEVKENPARKLKLAQGKLYYMVYFASITSEGQLPVSLPNYAFVRCFASVARA